MFNFCGCIAFFRLKLIIYYLPQMSQSNFSLVLIILIGSLKNILEFFEHSKLLFMLMIVLFLPYTWRSYAMKNIIV